LLLIFFLHFFINHPSPTVLYTLSLHDALPIFRRAHDIIEMTALKYWYDPQWATRVLTQDVILDEFPLSVPVQLRWGSGEKAVVRSEEHTSELQSRFDLVCRLLLEKKKKMYQYT